MLAGLDQSAISILAWGRLVLVMVFVLRWETLIGGVPAVMVGRVELVTTHASPSAAKATRMRIHVLGGNFHLQPWVFALKVRSVFSTFRFRY